MLLRPKKQIICSPAIIRVSRRQLIMGAAATAAYAAMGTTAARANFGLTPVAVNAFQTSGGTVTNAITLNTLTADSLFMVFGAYSGGVTCVPNDSQSNTWTSLTVHNNSFSRSVIWYVKNATVNASHGFGCNAADFASVAVYAFAGSHLTSLFDVEGTATGSGGSTQNAGPITPSADGYLVLATCCPPASSAGGTMTVDSGFTLPSSTNIGATSGFEGNATAYKVLGAGTGGVAISPTFSGYANTGSAGASASFKPASYTPPGGATNRLMMHPIP